MVEATIKMKNLMIDSHAHLCMDQFDTDRDQVLQRAFHAGIQAILCPADIFEPKSLETTLGLTERYQNIIAVAGVHPHNAKSFNPDDSLKIEELAAARKIKGVGEIGLDFHYNFSSPSHQEKALRYQLELAEKLNLPVILHSRESGKELNKAIQDARFTRGGIVHCFTEGWETAKTMMDHNFFISFSGILTFPNAYPIREVAEKIPCERLLIETDSPYLIPHPLRKEKKRNEPAFVIEVAKALAEIKSLSLQELTRQTSENFKSIFQFEI